MSGERPREGTGNVVLGLHGVVAIVWLWQQEATRWTFHNLLLPLTLSLTPAPPSPSSRCQQGYNARGEGADGPAGAATQEL